MNNRNSRLLPFVTGAAVGVLGGLIGLGGAEFRLPVLVGWFQFPVLLAIVINLLVSLVTVVVSLGFRANVQGIALLMGQWPIAVNLLSGSLLGSYFGVQFATRASDRALIVAVTVILALLGLLLIGHDWLFSHGAVSLPYAIQVVAGFLAGLVIGTVSSLLGVAGGELIIPSLVFLFGLDIKLAGSVSLMISVPTVVVGILRYRQKPVFQEVFPEWRFILDLALGSFVGAWLGSRFLPFVSTGLLQVSLGFILLLSASKMALSKLAPARQEIGTPS